MSITIDLSPSEEAQLATEAEQAGLAPPEIVARLVREHLAPVQYNTWEQVQAKLKQWRTETETPDYPDIPLHELFAQWAEEDANCTEAEIEANERMLEEINQSIRESRGYTGMRSPFGA